LSDISGLVLWPLGFICLVWGRRYRAAVAWVEAALFTCVAYFHGYSYANSQCRGCTASFDVHHPIEVVKFFVTLVGNVLPTGPVAGLPGILSRHPVNPYFGAHEVLGLVICVAAGYVVVQTVHERREAHPLPVLLITFGVLFDLMITEGRAGAGVLEATVSEFTMPNLILLLGLVVYASRHAPDLRRGRSWRPLAAGILAVFLVGQAVAATHYGIGAGRARHRELETDARIVVNAHRLSSEVLGCDVSLFVSYPIAPSVALVVFPSWRSMAMRDGLSVFQSAAELHSYTSEGPPRVSQCGQ
jgi:hypothetical protein